MTLTKYVMEHVTVKSCCIVSLVLVAVLGFVASAYSATITAANCSSAAVGIAVAAASNGDTVVVPAGTCQWTTVLTISKAITLQGNGTGSTIVQDGVNSGALMMWTLVANQASRLTGIEFRNNGRVSQDYNGVITISGSNSDSRTMRVDHCRFDHLNGVALAFDTVIGVVDHNTYLGTPTRRFINVWGSRWDGGTFGDKSWTASTGWGSRNFLFVEDNTMTYDAGQHYAFIDGFGGPRYVFRYNTVIRGWVEAHGTESTGRFRGTRAIEVYNNTFTADGGGNVVVNVRSGTALIHHNTVTGYQSDPRFQLANYRNNESFAPWGMANGTNAWDLNSGGILIEALDQPGKSSGSQISGDPPVIPSGWYNQVNDPCYEWSNTHEGGAAVSFVASHATIRVNQHYFAGTQAPGYTPYTYPHPLTAGSPLPSSPTHLRITR